MKDRNDLRLQHIFRHTCTFAFVLESDSGDEGLFVLVIFCMCVCMRSEILNIKEALEETM